MGARQFRKAVAKLARNIDRFLDTAALALGSLPEIQQECAGGKQFIPRSEFDVITNNVGGHHDAQAYRTLGSAILWRIAEFSLIEVKNGGSHDFTRAAT